MTNGFFIGQHVMDDSLYYYDAILGRWRLKRRYRWGFWSWGVGFAMGVILSSII